MNIAKSVASLLSLVSLSFGQLQVDSIVIDSVWNSDSTWYDANGIFQSQQNREVILGFKPIGPDSVFATFKISTDSAKTWFHIGDTNHIACNQTFHTKFRVVGGDRPNTAFQVILWDYDSLFEFLQPTPQSNLIVGQTVTIKWKYSHTASNMFSIFLSTDSGQTFTEFSDAIDSLLWKPTMGQLSKKCVLMAEVPGNISGPLPIVKFKSGLFSINLPDSLPLITLAGPNPDSIVVGTSFTEPGGSVIDNANGAIPFSNVIITGTDGQPLIISASTPVGAYTLVYNVKDNAGNPAKPVMRTIVVTAAGDALLQKYGLPLSTALPTLNATYKTIAVEGNGPNMSTVTSFSVYWDLTNNLLFAFSLNYSSSPYYMSFNSTNQTFNQPSPQFTISGTSIAGLDGSYYLKADVTQCVWVRNNGSFAIIFKP